ncbi:MAG: hypothetical protein ACK559_36850, partial [bacterium]
GAGRAASGEAHRAGPTESSTASSPPAFAPGSRTATGRPCRRAASLARLTTREAAASGAPRPRRASNSRRRAPVRRSGSCSGSSSALMPAPSPPRRWRHHGAGRGPPADGTPARQD